MEYTVNKLSQLAGVSTRTLRYYDEIGLLQPMRINSSGYRIYGKNEVNKLQEILFYRELGMSLENIKTTLSQPGFKRIDILQEHLTALVGKRRNIDILIQNVEASIKETKGGIIMNDNEKFEGLKQQLIQENEEKYGDEIRGIYGDDIIGASNSKLMGMSNEDFDKAFSPKLNEALKLAFDSNAPGSDLAMKACEMHKEWLCFFWPEGMYTKEMHLGMGEMYVSDERFKKYYDNIVPGLAQFFHEALKIYCK